MADKKPSEREAKHLYWIAEALQRLEYDMCNEIHRQQRIPVGWHELATSGVGPKKRVTIRVEEDVLKFFKSMGYGYHGRMNDVLKAFMHAKLARVLRGSDTPEGFVARQPVSRPDWGEFG